MCEPFIRSYQYNFIKNQADYVLHTLRTVGDPKVVAGVRSNAQAKVAELFPMITDDRITMLESVSDLKTGEDLQKYVQALEPYLVAFPPITEQQIRKLFPKVKKLKVPDLTQIDFRYVSYLSWVDIATNKMFIVYHKDGQFIGVEGRFTETNKKSYCFVCNRYEKLALFSATTRKRPANTTPDYYKSVGNYVCTDGHICNKNVTDITSLERFIESVLE